MNYVKLSAPKLQKVIPRARLFTLLDQQRQAAPVIWLCAPPGAGKTALVASWLAQCGAPSIWFQVDAGDNDPLTFFTFLARALGKPGAALPLDVPQDETELQRYARAFFREFYARMPQRAVLVLDNLQELDWTAHGALLEIAVSEIPSATTVLALSRAAPPARLSRLELNGGLVCIHGDALRFTQEESFAAAELPELPDRHSLEWLALVEGWAAGIAVLREHRARHAEAAAAGKLAMPDPENTVYRYFEGEVLHRLPAESRSWLLLMSCLPALCGAEAEQLTGSSRASALLRRLANDHLFIERSHDEKACYRFHPLFRACLEEQARNEIDADARMALMERAAALLEQRNEVAQAALMLRDAGASSALASLLTRSAPDMLRAGRGDAWREWLGWLPPAAAADPWLQYWNGAAQIHSDPLRALQQLQQAERAFAGIDDQPARLLALAAVVDCLYFGLNNFAALAPWIPLLEQALAAAPSGLDPQLELKCHSRLAIAIMLTSPESAALQEHAARVVQALAHVEAADARLEAGAILLHCMDWLSPDTTRWVLAEIGPLAENAGINAFTRCWWSIRAGLWFVYCDGDLGAAAQVTNAGLQLAEGLQLERLAFHLKYNKALILLAQNDLDAAPALLAELKPLISPARKLDLARFASLETNYALQLGDQRKGLQSAQEMIGLSSDAGLPIADSPLFDRYMATCYAHAEDFERAELWYERAISNSTGPARAFCVNARDLVRACALAHQGDQLAAMPLLQDALSTHRQEGRSAFFVRFPQLASRIAALALDADIEKDHVRSIIRRQRLKAPGPFSANWPWPVAVRTLGSLTLSLNGDLLAFSGKAQQRPLVLLKALLLAPESGQTLQIIADHLWPDVADARASLNVTIHRLRKLLGNDDAVLVAAGKLSIDRSLVWSDVDALTDLCDRIQLLPASASVSETNQLAVTLLSLYRGAFSDGSDESWLLSGRNRLSNRFLDAATALGVKMEQLGQLAMANTLYLRALEVEPLAETLYRNLMRCAHAQNDPSAAFSAYRRCRETLSVILGRRPSPETDRLAVSIGLIEHAP